MMEYNIYSGILKIFSDFNNDELGKVSFKYEMDHPSYELLRDKYDLIKIAGKDSDLSKALNLLTWLSESVSYKGNSGNEFTEQNAFELLNYAFGKGEKYGINCLALSITLSECFHAVGLTSKVVSLNPLSPYDCDNHVVVSVYIEENRKWIMVDPTYNAYISDLEGNILGLVELREKLANQDEVIFNKGVNCNGDYCIDHEELKTYMAKNLFYFRSSQIQTFGSHELRENTIEFVPRGFNVKERMIENNKYLIKTLAKTDVFIKRLEKIRSQKIKFGRIGDIEEMIK